MWTVWKHFELEFYVTWIHINNDIWQREKYNYYDAGAANFGTIPNQLKLIEIEKRKWKRNRNKTELLIRKNGSYPIRFYSVQHKSTE